MNFSEKEDQGRVGTIINRYYSKVGQQPKNSWIQEQINSGALFAIVFFVFCVLVLYFAIKWLKSQSQAKEEDMTRGQEKEDDCQCDDCVERRNKK